MLKQMRQVRLCIHKKLNFANKIYYKKLIIFKNQFISRLPDAVDCYYYSQTTTKFSLNT